MRMSYVLVPIAATVALVGGALEWQMAKGQPSSAPVTPITASDRLAYEQNTIQIARQDGVGVVYVSVRTAARNLGSQLPQGLQEFAPFFFGPGSQQMVQPPQQGTGSGFVIDNSGHILTNYHVVNGADQITVRFYGDPKNYTAHLEGSAPALDLALLKVSAPQADLHPLPLANSDMVQVGEKAIAIGNPFGLESTVTEGIVSAVRQNPGAVQDLVPRIIQTDAAINPGNSGGPLLNSAGQVIGINTAILSPSGAFGQAQFAGVGFAIPINLAKQYLPQMEAGKQIKSSEILASRPHLGIEVSPLQAYPSNLLSQNKLPSSGLMIEKLDKGSPAEKVGLKAASKSVYLQDPSGQAIQLGLNGDVIVEANGVQINDVNDLRGVLDQTKSGQAVSLKIWNHGQERTVQVVPAVSSPG